MPDFSLAVPFLDGSPRYCRGVELGLSVAGPMLAGAAEVKGYFQSRNEEQIRLTAHRLGYSVDELEPWRWEGQATGWVWMLMRKLAPAESPA